jgi:hypothetical protein
MTEPDAKPKGDTEDEADLLQQALDDFKRCEEAHSDNRRDFEDDVKFARLGEQWDAGLKLKRQREGRPCLTINKLPPFIRQVVNDARQNKPSIKVLPQDSGADPETAEIISGLIRNIETSSDADVAYDTALDNAATGGFGYFRINLAYAHDGSFDQDIIFERIANPLTVYPDPDSEAADSSDWSICFVTRHYSKAQFERMFPAADPVNFAAQEWPSGWCEGERVQVAEYWVREPAPREIVLLDNGQVVDLSDYQKNPQLYEGVQPVGEPREVEDFKVTQHILNGVEVLSSTEWAGKFIPIVPVYGEEVFADGKRHLRSLTRDARDAQVMYNAWRTASTELVALAPKAPFIGPKGAFSTDQARWETANNASHPYIEYDGNIPPQRQPFTGVPAGALQEALNASDDMKSIIGIYDAGIGARSNETSGRAIMARQKESDTSTFHFIDNLSRAIRHAGRIIIDLIPKVYSPGRMIRILGEDGEPKNVAVGSPEEAQMAQQQQAEQQAAMRGIYALGAGRYDLTVTVGPSFNTRREEAATQMMEMVRAFPQLAQVAGDILAKNLDWPGADEIADRLKALQQQAQQAQGPQQPPQDPAAMAKLQLQAQDQQTRAQLDQQKLQIDGFEAETARMKVVHDMQQPTRLPQMPGQTG